MLGTYFITSFQPFESVLVCCWDFNWFFRCLSIVLGLLGLICDRIRSMPYWDYHRKVFSTVCGHKLIEKTWILQRGFLGCFPERRRVLFQSLQHDPEWTKRFKLQVDKQFFEILDRDNPGIISWRCHGASQCWLIVRRFLTEEYKTFSGDYKISPQNI